MMMSEIGKVVVVVVVLVVGRIMCVEDVACCRVFVLREDVLEGVVVKGVLREVAPVGDSRG